MTDTTKFWMVWAPSGRSPTMKHATKAKAIVEAQRLAKNNPSHRFYVLKAIGGFEAVISEPKPIILSKPAPVDEDDVDAEIPF